MSQCDRVLAVLADGHEHSISEIHERAGTMRLNSRVAELRTRGYAIECSRDGNTYSYRLVSLREPEPREAAAAFPAESTAGSMSASGSRSESPEQLSFEVAA